MTDADRRAEAMRMLEHEVGVMLRRVRKGIGERATAVHPELSSTSFTLLVTLAETGPKRAADLAEIFALDKGSVSRLVHQLVDLGLIERVPDPNDGRASILGLTEDAVRRLAAMREERFQQFDARLATWAPGEIRDLAERLERFNETLS
ncbi:MAG: MarR family transcriptional regulator [Nocardioidaceae bacterium]|nr:MarR family transcriptional regulator [Nocardioidaceae bacterium]